MVEMAPAPAAPLAPGQEPVPLVRTIPATSAVASMVSQGVAPYGGAGGDFWGSPGQANLAITESLNSDPHNLRAEELALEDCAQGVEVRRTWSEKEMVRSFDGRHFPGTPDGMFENWDGALTCVQVVRVPLIPELSLDGMHETLAHTILTKVVKSQQWLRASHVVPEDFVIFCWLPFTVAQEVVDVAERLMEHVREMDQRFSLRLRVPAEASALFPALFASNHDIDRQKTRGFSWSDVSTYTGDEESEEDDEVAWDITWGWDDDDQSCGSPTSGSGGAMQAQEGEEEVDSEEEWEWEWDITWGWESDWTVAAVQGGAQCDSDGQFVDGKVALQDNQGQQDSGQQWKTFDGGG